MLVNHDETLKVDSFELFIHEYSFCSLQSCSWLIEHKMYVFLLL